MKLHGADTLPHEGKSGSVSEKKVPEYEVTRKSGGVRLKNTKSSSLSGQVGGSRQGSSKTVFRLVIVSMVTSVSAGRDCETTNASADGGVTVKSHRSNAVGDDRHEGKGFTRVVSPVIATDSWSVPSTNVSVRFEAAEAAALTRTARSMSVTVRIQRDRRKINASPPSRVA